MGIGWIRGQLVNYIGGPLRQLELWVKDHLLGEKPTEGWYAWLGDKAMSAASGLGTWIDWMTLGYGSSAWQKAAEWAEYAQSLLPERLQSQLSLLKPKGLRKWLEDRLEFIEKLDGPTLPSLGISGEGEGEYKGYGQVEDYQAALFMDLSVPESYVMTWVKALQEKFFPESKFAEGIVSALSGKLKLLSIKDFNFSFAKGLRGLLPSLELGEAFQAIWNMVKRVAGFVKGAWGALAGSASKP